MLLTSLGPLQRNCHIEEEFLAGGQTTQCDLQKKKRSFVNDVISLFYLPYSVVSTKIIVRFWETAHLPLPYANILL